MISTHKTPSVSSTPSAQTVVRGKAWKLFADLKGNNTID